MRRPSPLPPPAEPRRPAPPARDPQTDPSAADDRPDAAPVTPLAAARIAQEPAVDAVGDAAYDTAAGEQRELGVRDLWRAARARRRALRAEVRRFTVRQRRRRMVWLGIGGALLLLVVGTVGAAYSPLFAVQRIEVVGTSQLDPALVADALGEQIGTPLALVDDSAIKAELVTFPLVESYTLEARPPNDLVVRIVERMPVGVVSTAAGFTVVDAAGVALSTSPQAPAGLPTFDVRGGLRSEAFLAAGQVMRSLPQTIRAQVTAVTATTTDDVAFVLGATDTRVVWGSAERSAFKALVLERTMATRPPDGTRLYDVSAPEAVVIG